MIQHQCRDGTWVGSYAEARATLGALEQPYYRFVFSEGLVLERRDFPADADAHPAWPDFVRAMEGRHMPEIPAMHLWWSFALGWTMRGA